MLANKDQTQTPEKPSFHSCFNNNILNNFLNIKHFFPSKNESEWLFIDWIGWTAGKFDPPYPFHFLSISTRSDLNGPSQNPFVRWMSPKKRKTRFLEKWKWKTGRMLKGAFLFLSFCSSNGLQVHRWSWNLFLLFYIFGSLPFLIYNFRRKHVFDSESWWMQYITLFCKQTPISSFVCMWGTVQFSLNGSTLLLV